MEQAAAALEFEQAARFRDQIAGLSRLQERQYVTGERGDLDIVACAVGGGSSCVQLFFIRGGRNLGNKAFFPNAPADIEAPELISAFIARHYLGAQVPAEILVSALPTDHGLLEEVLERQAGHKVRLRSRVRGERARWLEMTRNNARLALESRLASRGGMQRRIESLREALDLDETPQRMECFDISHTGGELTVASCVVFDQEGPRKSDYRRFNIRDITPGDDYAAMRQALSRRYTRVQKGEGRLPDLLLIDGGKGQLGVAREVLEELGLGDLTLVGVAKGPDRRPGLERLFLSGAETPIILPSDSPPLHLIQQIRDEAHRFAITGHRQRRARSRRTSALEGIPGIGPKRRQRLLKQFGGLQELARAGVEDLSRVEGISRQLAQQIYDAFRGET
jgi:excinuclease ABC subunit C